MNRHGKYVKEKCRVYEVPITVKSLRFYLTWSLTIWPASFMDADRRYRNPRSKTKKCLLTVIVIAEDLAFFFTSSLCPISSRAMWRHLHTRLAAVQYKCLKHWESKYFVMAVSMPDLCLEGDTISVLKQQTNLFVSALDTFHNF